nr:ribonuclease H-like domain-containing protein [Tanacetum cinerariifolium]
MDQDSVHMVAASKVPMLKPCEYELWRMRMEQYIQMVDYSLWVFIENANSASKTKLVEGVKAIIPPTTTKEKAQRRLEFKARSTLLMGIPNEHQLKFNSIKDAKSLLQAVEKKNKPDIDTLSLDDLYNNLKIYEPKVKETSSSSTNTQNVAFLSSNSTSSTNGVVNTAHGATTASTQATVDLQQIQPDDLEERDLRWQMAMQTMRARRLLKKTGRKFFVNGNETIRENIRRVMPVKTTTSNALISCDGAGYDWSDQAEEGPTNFALMAYASTSSNSDVSTDSNCSSSCLENVKILKERNEQLLKDLRTSKLNVIAYKTCLESVEARLLVYKKNEHVYEEDIKPTVMKPEVETSETKASTNNPKVVRKNNGAPIIEKWVFDSENEAESNPKIEKKIVKPSFAKIEFVKPKKQQDLEEKGVIDSGCSRHMTRNMFYLTNFKEIDEGYVAFGGNPKGWKITRIVVTNDYSRFSWVFFLATKDETSGILKSFVTRVENLIDQKVKVIRCDNGNEFKNKGMNQFCKRKGIKREFSVAKTPQQNEVAERKNITLIEVARTMLTDSKLPTTLWAEAVNIVCYVQNKVLVTKPHNKTPYKLFLGRKPALGFIKPFGCHVTILNTIDHLGKFDGKDDDGFFVGYSISSKAFRVFNIRTRIVEENLHVQFSKNTPNIEGSGPNWLFDIDALTKSINYKPFVVGNQSNGNAGTKACDDADFMMYQMDVKSAFLYGKIEEKVYVCQPLGFEDLDFPDRVYKVEKALYGLHQAPRSWYETLSAYLLDNSVKTASTPMETQKHLLKDKDDEEVDVHLYRSMIDSLMYLTSSRLDIMFAVCACARYQVNPKNAISSCCEKNF